MKRLFVFLILSAFVAVSVAEAAPARSTRGVSSKARVSTQKSTSRKATTRSQAKKVAQKQPQIQSQSARREAQEKDKQLGLMPSKLDEFNRNAFSADAAAIKGARDTESALRYIPFVTIVNTAGFGQAFDLRSQGRLSSNGVKLYINGVPVNPVDSYSLAMPINTVLPQLISNIEVYPGSGAVQYGAGTKGGTINIITSKPKAPYFVIGAGYLNTTGVGNSFNAFASVAEDFGTRLSVNAALGGSKIAGPREDDDTLNGEFVFGVDYQLGLGSNIRLDTDTFYSKIKTTPYNSLYNYDAINDIMLNNPVSWGTTAINANEQGRYVCFAGTGNTAGATQLNCTNPFYEPDENDRATKGYGELETTTLRSSGALALTLEPTQKLSFKFTGLYSLETLKYDSYKQNMPFFMVGYVNPTNIADNGLVWFLPRPSSDASRTWIWDTVNTATGTAFGQNGNIYYGPAYSNVVSDGERADWHFIDQSGSTFSEYKAGGKASMNWKHTNGEFVLGLEGLYEMGKKKQSTYLRQAIIDTQTYGGTNTAYIQNASNYQTFLANIDNQTDINVVTAAVFLMENYRLNKNLSLMLGARYEMKNYGIKIKDEFDGSNIEFAPSGTSTDAQKIMNRSSWRTTTTAKETFESEDYKKSYDNFTFELAPAYRYSNSGVIYARGEMGYIAPPAWAMLQRIGKINAIESPASFRQNTETREPLGFNFAYLETELKSESYWTAELGWKESILKRIVPLGFMDLPIDALLFSANVFYTNSSNEFYFTGDSWSGMSFGNYDKSRRIGGEVALEQILFDGALSFNESLAYTKAQQFENEEWKPIPYTYDWKATVGAAINISGYVEITDASVSFWIQNSLYGNQNVYSRNIYVYPSATAAGVIGNTAQQPWFSVKDGESKKLDPYVVSDLGISVGVAKNTAMITVGVKNVFNTFYYDYYNADRSAVMNENRYLIGRGRTVFVEAEWKY